MGLSGSVSSLYEVTVASFIVIEQNMHREIVCIIVNDTTDKIF